MRFPQPCLVTGRCRARIGNAGDLPPRGWCCGQWDSEFDQPMAAKRGDMHGVPGAPRSDQPAKLAIRRRAKSIERNDFVAW